jgi:hypothetical protein
MSPIAPARAISSSRGDPWYPGWDAWAWIYRFDRCLRLIKAPACPIYYLVLFTAAQPMKSSNFHAVEALAKTYRRPIHEVAALYEREAKKLAATATVPHYVGVIASKKVADVLKEQRENRQAA